MVQCDHALPFWEAATDFFSLKLPRLHPVTWTMNVVDPSFLNKRDASIAISVMWAIWTSRNKYTHGEVVYQPRKAMELVDEFIKALDIPVGEVPK
jgi:hypothetical protein